MLLIYHNPVPYRHRLFSAKKSYGPFLPGSLPPPYYLSRWASRISTEGVGLIGVFLIERRSYRHRLDNCRQWLLHLGSR